MKKAITKHIKKLAPFTPILMIIACCIMVAAIVVNHVGDTTQQFADLKEEFKAQGVRFFVIGEVSHDPSCVVLLDIATKAEFIQLIETHQPKILYYNLKILDVGFSFFEDEAESQIAYRWFYEFER